MFTGIVQNIGSIIDFNDGVLKVSTPLDLSDCSVGSSICCNGVCLTATEIIFNENEYTFSVNLGEETQNRTNFSPNFIHASMKINIEKSLKVGDEISGHFVYGHVDRVTKINNINKLENSWEFSYEKFKDKDQKFIVEKASIVINGISLTIANVDKDSFKISIIPHTFENTNLRYLKKNDIVNVEFDYLARFII